MGTGHLQESGESRPRKQSLAAAPLDRPLSQPTTFFLRRGSDGPEAPSTSSAGVTQNLSPVRSLKETLEEADRSTSSHISQTQDHEARSSSRRRSTIKALESERTRRYSSPHEHTLFPPGSQDGRSTPSPLPSASSPSSPKSISSRSMPKSDEELTISDTGSQAVASSEEDEDAEVPPAVQDSAPQLVMPSIRMPSRRPFTERGKKLGRFKILVAGRNGMGKTSLIKSIVQLCDDIVHVDSLNPSSGSSINLTSTTESRRFIGETKDIVEVYASTKPYPDWWSDLDGSRILRRRKSIGNSVLERNICFVDATKVERVIYYLEQQFLRTVYPAIGQYNDLAGLLSGRGGPQVDVVLYLLSRDSYLDDLDQMKRLSEFTNVVPVIAKSDTVSAMTISDLKSIPALNSMSLPRLSTGPASEAETEAPWGAAPYTVSSANGPDTDTMEASLLMSPEYVQPLVPSELQSLVDHLFNPDLVACLRHTAAQKLISWHASNPKITRMPTSSITSPRASTLSSPVATSISHSGVLVPITSDISLNTSNSYALARVTDHTQREERLAQLRLAKWASDLQGSLQRERERYERLARGDRAVWLMEKVSEEAREGQIVPVENHQALVKGGLPTARPGPFSSNLAYTVHDPLGLLRWQDAMRTRGWIALQIVGGVGVLGGLAMWLFNWTPPLLRDNCT